jgi:hypothetical protein
MVHTRAMLAAPFVAMAVVVSSPVGAFAAVVAPFQPRGSSLLARQGGQVQIPPQCDSQCVPIVNTLNVSTRAPLTVRAAESPTTLNS